MTLADPFWLVLIIPLAMSLWWWRLPTRLILGLRCVAWVLLLLALCNLSLRLPAHCGTVVLVADRSLSMPPDSTALERQAADLLGSAMPVGDRLGVVSFAETAAVEQSPQAGKFAGFSVEVGREASHLADALDLALSLLGPDAPGRILVLSDGQWTGRDISSPTARAAAAGVAIDYRLMERSRAGDLAVQGIQGPESTLPGESFMITAWLDSPLAQTVSYELLRGSQVIARGTQAVPSGTSRLLFRDTAPERGVCEYLLRTSGQAADPMPENNQARLLVGVRGARPLLCVSPAGNSGLSALLSKGGLSVKTLPASQCNWTLEELAGYSGVLLENTPANLLGHVGMENLAAWVVQSGGGLMTTGGKESYGPGGYFKSPLEPVMPVSMELRREHRKLSLAIVVALDRSGSMAMPVPGGRAKMDLANLATAEVIDMLGTMDQFGCVAVDSASHVIVPLGDVSNKAAMRSKVLRIDSQGGGIFIYEALATAAKMILPAKAGTRHIVLFADAADSEQPGDYKTLVDKCVKAGITISVIGLGTEKDCDAGLLKDIAARGGGQCMFTNIAQELPRLFAQDTFLIARSAFLEDPVPIRPTGGLVSITRQPLNDFPNIGGYNLCYLRPEANLAIVSVDEYQAPILAAWQAGLGRVLCYTGEADGKFTGPIAGWTSTGDFFTSLARWTAGKSDELGRGVVATQEMRNGVCRVELHLDPARQTAPFTRLPELTTLSARAGETAAARKTAMRWSSADTLLGEIPLSGGQTALTTVAAPGMGQATLAPMCLPYSPEYLPQRREGVGALDRLARSTGGCERLNLADVWKDIPRKPRFISLAPYLLLASVVIFLLEVVQRRSGLLSARWRWFGLLRNKLSERTRGWSTLVFKAKTRKITARAAADPPTQAVTEPPGPTAPAEAQPDNDGMLDALAHAQQRARRRTERR